MVKTRPMSLVPYGGVSDRLSWFLFQRQKVYRCPKCRHGLELSLDDNNLHCPKCGHVEYVEYGDPEALQ